MCPLCSTSSKFQLFVLRVKYLGEEGENTLFAGAASIFSPWDLVDFKQWYKSDSSSSASKNDHTSCCSGLHSSFSMSCSCFLLLRLSGFERAAIAAANPITYHSRELLQLIHEHLQASGFMATAVLLQKQADITPLPSSGVPPLALH